MTRNLWIQVLRGVSVVSVVLFHLSPNRFHYGYLGVDSFFVISGFLMQSIYGDIRKPNQILKFWKKRAARLFPAYFCVVGLTYIAGLLILLPHEKSVLIQHIRWSEFFLPNIGYWTDSQYWGSQEFRPLLNLWSLGVEIQFYFLFPFIIKYFYRLRLIAILTLISFFSYIMVYEISEKTAFFLTPFRIWEFCLGIATAILLKGHLELFIKWSKIMGITCILISGSLIAMGPFDPRFMTLLIALLTALSMNTNLKGETLTKILKPLIWVGDRSYSIYLIHFPLLAFLLYEPFQSNSSPNFNNRILILIAYIFLLLTLSNLSYKFVENGVRKSKVFKLATPLILILLIFSSFLDLSRINFSHYSDRQVNASLAVLDYAPYRCGKTFRLTHPFSNFCPLAAHKSQKENVLLIGDSHADMFKAPLMDIARSSNVGFWLWAHNESIHASNFEKIKRILNSKFFTKVIVTSNAGGTDLDLLERLIKSSPQKFSYINPIPIYGDSIPEVVFESADSIPQSLTQSRVQFLDSHREELSKLKEIELNSGLQILDLTNNLCPRMCLLVHDGKPIYSDNNHLTQNTVRRLRHRLSEIMG